jgi:hypothetical protein
MGKSSSSSSTSTPVTNQEVAVQTGAGAGVAVGAGATTGAVNITSGDVVTSQAAIAAAAAAVNSIVGLASDESHTEVGVIEHEGDGDRAVATSALAVGQNLGLASLQFAQNETMLNLNALNTNTALAFSTINNLTAAQEAGQISSAAQMLSAATTAAGASGTATPTIIYAGTTQQPLTSGTGTSKVSTGGWIAIAAVAAIGLYFVTRK